MKKVNLVIIGLFMLFSLPMVLGITENTVNNVSGNTSGTLYFALTTTQVTVNPGLGDNVTYCTTINVTSSNASSGATYNLSNFNFVLPDNHSVQLASYFQLANSSKSTTLNASAFVIGDYDYVIFTGVGSYLNHSSNASTFNITWIMNNPITATKITSSRAGRAYTETWNVSTAASNLTIDNASIVVKPTYWYTRVGAPTVSFNSTALTTYQANHTDIEVWTNLTIGTNMLEGGSGYATLSVAYNGPSIDSSSGSSSSAVVPTAEITPSNFALWGFIGLGLLFVVGMVVLGILYLKDLKGKK